MAWWRRPNSTLANIAEAAAAGLPPGFEAIEAIATTPDPASPIDLWLSATNDRMACGHFTQVDDRMHFTRDVASTCQFWSEGVLSTSVAAFGLVGNLVSIWVLSVPEMRCNAFNRLLLALACIDCLFIGPGILIYTFKAFKLEADWYNYLFPIVFYPFSEIALCSSIYMTVAIAVERFIGLCRPFRRLTSRPSPAKAYILPVLLLSVILNIPKFLESETVVSYDYFDGENVTATRVGVTWLRTNPDYITYYTMLIRFLATGFAPLALLVILNTKIYLALRRSKAQLRSLAIRAALPMAILGKPATPPSQMDLRIDATGAPPPWRNGHHVNGHMSNGNGNGNSATPLNLTPKSPRPHPMNRSVSAAIVETTRLREPLTRSHSTAAATPTLNGHAPVAAPPPPPAAQANDLNLAPILFGVVIVFGVCNLMRIVLNIYDFYVLDEIIDCEKRGVGRMPPAWIMCSISVSHFLLMVNSSVNFLVYCVAGSKFRTILSQHLSSLFKRLRPHAQQHLRPSQHLANNGGLNGFREAALVNNETALLHPQRQRNNKLMLNQHPRIVEINENDATHV
jgi:hypothetical protein